MTLLANDDGVMPNARLKDAEKWLWLEKPHDSASSVRSISGRARSREIA